MVDPEIRQRCELFYNSFQGATEAQITALETFAGCSLPQDYVEFLRFSNGFLDLSSVEDVLSDSGSFRKCETGGLVIGNDGGEGILVLDLRGAPSAVSYAYMPDERHHWEHVGTHWPDFKTLFLDITPSKLR